MTGPTEEQGTPEQNPPEDRAPLLVGFYRMMAGYLNTVQVNREEGVPGFPG